MHINGCGDARSAVVPAPLFSRDSASAAPDHHHHPSTPLWDRQVFSRDKFDRLDRDRYILAKKDWAPDNRSYSGRSSAAASFANRGVTGRRRVLGRHAPGFENGRHGSSGGHGNSGSQNLRSPPDNGKAERDFFVMSGGISPGYSTSEKQAKSVDGNYLRDSHGSSPRFDSHPHQFGSQYGVEGLMSSEREKAKTSGSPYVWEASHRDRDLRERVWSRPEYCRRTCSLPKLDSSREWNHGGRDLLEGRIDRYSNTSSREAGLPDILNRDHSRYYDWRSKDRSLFNGLSPWSRASTNNINRREVGTPSSRLEMPRVVSPPALRSCVSLDSYYNDAGLASPRKRPRLTWGQGLAKYEKERTEEEPPIPKKESCHESVEGACDFEGRSFKIGSASPYQDSVEKGLGSLISGPAKKDGEEKDSQAASKRLKDLNIGGCHDSVVASANVVPPSLSELHDVHVFLESYHWENPSVPKDVLTRYVERVEVQIELAEKEIIKLENEYGIHVPRERADAACHEKEGVWMPKAMVHEEVFGHGCLGASSLTELPVQDFDMVPCLKEIGPQSHPTSKDRQGSEDLDMPVAYLEPSCICETAGERETIFQDFLDVKAEKLLSFGQDGKLGDDEQSIGRPEGGKPGQDEEILTGLESEQRIALPGAGEGSIAGHEEDIISCILHSNQKAAERSLSHLQHLICSGMDVIWQKGRLYGSLEEVDAWKRNVQSFLGKRESLERKVFKERAVTNFSEKVLAAKYIALREQQKLPKQAAQAFHVAHKRGYLTMPRMYLGEREAIHHFQTKNGLVDDPVAAEQERKAVNLWSTEERKTFLDKYGLFGKDFRKISRFLVHKTVADCIEFYYRNQKTEAFEEVRRQNRMRKCRDDQARDVYLVNATAISSRHYDESSLCLEGLSLVAEAAAAISTPRDYYTRTSQGFATKLCTEVCPTTRLCAPVKGGNKDKSGGKGVRSTHARAKAEMSSHWSDNERELFMDALLMYGKDFQSISGHVGSKSEWQCRTFFSKACRHLGLDELVVRHNAIAEALDVGERDEANMEPLQQLDCAPLVDDNTAKTVLCGGGHTLMHHHEAKDCPSRLVTSIDGRGSYVAPEPWQGKCNACYAASTSSVKAFLEADTARSDTSEARPMDNLPKQGSCSTYNGEKQAMVSGCFCSASMEFSIAPYSSVEKSLVCRETLEFKMPPVKVEAEPTPATISPGSGTCDDAIASHHPGLLPAAPVRNSLPTSRAPIMQRKEPCAKLASETKARREPTSWTQDEKEKFLEVLKGHGKDWARLRECLPGKSLTQIKTYFQNSKSKLGFGPEGGNGRVCASRKRKTDDSDSSSNAGSGGQAAAAPPKGPMYYEDGSLNVSSGFRAPSSNMGGNGLTHEAPLYANLFGRSDSNNSTAGIHPLLNPSVFPSPNVGASQPPYVHPSMVTSQQIMNFPQPQQAPLAFQQLLPQPATSVGIHQAHQLQLPIQPGMLMFPEIASIAVQHHLHKQPTLQQAEALQPQLLQRQYPQLHPQLPISTQNIPQHHFQPILGHRQAQSCLQISATTTNQPQQGSNVSSLLASTSQSLSAAHQLQQRAKLLQSQLYHMHAKALSSLPNLPAPQLKQLQALQLHWPQQQQPTILQQVQVMQGQLSHTQESRLTSLNEQQPVMRGTMEVMNGCSEMGKCQTLSVGQLPATDIKLFGQSLLSQPTVEQSGRLSCSSTAYEALASSSASVISYEVIATTPQRSVDVDLPGHGQHPTVSLLGRGPAGIHPRSACVHLGDTESELHHCSAQEAVARMNEKLMKEAMDMEDGQANEATTVSHDQVEQMLESSVEKGALIDKLGPQTDANTNDKCRVQDRDSLLPASASGQVASQGLPRVLDALVALAEWRLQNANVGSGRITDEFLSQSWEALQRDPVSLVEAGKAGGPLAHIYTGNVDMLQHLKDGLLCSWQSNLLHPSDPQRSLASTNAHRAEDPRMVVEAGDACSSRGAVG